MEAIILAGGLGTRLKAVTQQLPKPMAPIGSRPFLELLLDYVISQGITTVILSVGYKHEKISSHFGDKYKSCQLIYSIESEPLGTGGAIQYALDRSNSEDIFILNGDTFFRTPLNQMMSFHLESQSDLTLALKPMTNFDRYGNVVLSETKVIDFEEKQYRETGNINGGIYILKKGLIDRLQMPSKFSFETDLLEAFVNDIKVSGFIADGYFIDIGIPEDYEKAQLELA